MSNNGKNTFRLDSDSQLVKLTLHFNTRFQSKPFGSRGRTSLQSSELEAIFDCHLNPLIKRGPFSVEEDQAIVQAYNDGKRSKEIGKEVFPSMGFAPRDRKSMDNRVKYLQKKGLLRKPEKTEDEGVQLVDLTKKSDIEPGLAGNILPHYIFGCTGPVPQYHSAMHYPGFYVGQQMSILGNVGTFQISKEQSGKGRNTSPSC